MNNPLENYVNEMLHDVEPHPRPRIIGKKQVLSYEQLNEFIDHVRGSNDAVARLHVMRFLEHYGGGK